ncbi:MAG: hypothetical protein NDF56_06210 [archaeon GB-1845-036]|nr:hypothetical protein [Candidatus Culexmicrobium thermophilum]
MNISEYVKHIIRGCGKEADYIIILKINRLDECLKRIIGKMVEKENLGGFYIKGKIENVEVNVFKNGRLLVRGISGEGELERFLLKIFQDEK